MPGAVVTQSAPTRTMQGIAVPSESVNPPLFFELTRRHQTPEKTSPTAAAASLRWSSCARPTFSPLITLRFVGSLVVTGGTTNSDRRVAAGHRRRPVHRERSEQPDQHRHRSGAAAAPPRPRLHDANSDQNDRASRRPSAASPARRARSPTPTSRGASGRRRPDRRRHLPVDLTFPIPVAEDERDLLGAIFLQTSTSDLTLSIDETPLNQLFAGGTATRRAHRHVAGRRPSSASRSARTGRS
jgi:hypothetical protein